MRSYRSVGWSFLVSVVLAATGVAFAAESLSISSAPTGPRKLQLRGEPGREYVVESTADLGTSSWNVLLRGQLGSTPMEWLDPASLTAPARFYRVLRLSESNPSARATMTNFRLLDHQGKSRELHYHSDRKAIVLVFASAACPDLSPLAPTLEAIQNEFAASGVLFWLVSPDAALSRTELAARASRLGLNWPVLADNTLAVAREARVQAGPEVVCLDPRDWSVFYRGAVDDRAGNTPATQTFLRNALAQFLAGQKVSPSQTQPSGCAVEIPPVPAVSYSADVAPLLIRSCVQCHSEGNIGPWQMTDYQVVKDYAASIKEEVLGGHMPPWHADPAHGRFSNDISLSAQDTAKLLRWIDDGAPRGTGPDPLADLFSSKPPPPDYPSTWPRELGEPDFVVTLPAFVVPASGEVAYQYITADVNLPTDAWLRAAVVLPGNRKVVHHALAFLGTGLDLIIGARLGLGGYFAAYVPGMEAREYPAGTAKLLPANIPVTLQMHYTTAGTEETDVTKVGFYFAKEAPQVELRTTAAATTSISIPPNAGEYEREAVITPSATNDVLIYELSPHMHYRGARMSFQAEYPNGTNEMLLSVPKYEFHWQTLYRLTEPKRLPAGTRIRVKGAFDNSKLNLENPNPNATVRFGEQTDDEMFIGYINYSVVP